MEVDNGGLAFFGEEESAVGYRVHKKVLYEDCRRERVAEQVEIGLLVRVAVGVVGAEALAGKVEAGGFVEAGSEGIGPGVAPRGVGAPAGGIVPAVATAGGVGVDGDEDDVASAEGLADGVDAAAAFGEGDVFALRHEELGIVAEVGEGGDNPGGNQPVLGVFAELPVGAALARSVHPVTVVDEDFHSWSCV